MIDYSLSQACSIVNGQLHGANGRFRGLSHDSRRLGPNALYAALPGAHVDGHDFIHDARDRGAAGALVSKHVASELAQIQVSDVLQAMGQLAAAWRKNLDLQVVGITGSNGKTTVKNMIASIVARYAKKNNENENNQKNHAYLATPGNYNNELGLPLTLAQLSAEHQFAILEMGCAKPGDITYLAGLAQPNIGVVTNASAAHLKGLGSVEGVAATKGELFTDLGGNDVAVINRDDRFFSYWLDQARPARIISFGLHAEADVRLDQQQVQTPEGEFMLELNLPGQHNQLNALAATAAALGLGIDLNTIALGLAQTRAEVGRLTRLSLSDQLTVLDDSYNANPASMRAALDVLAAQAGTSCVVIGDMAELADQADAEHVQIGRRARELGLDALFTLGPKACLAQAEFNGPGRAFQDLEALIDALHAFLESQRSETTTILVKGSRSLGMERVVAALQQWSATSC